MWNYSLCWRHRDDGAGAWRVRVWCACPSLVGVLACAVCTRPLLLLGYWHLADSNSADANNERQTVLALAMERVEAHSGVEIDTGFREVVRLVAMRVPTVLKAVLAKLAGTVASDPGTVSPPLLELGAVVVEQPAAYRDVLWSIVDTSRT